MSTIFLDASEHPVASVTVFKSSKAEVTRSFDIGLKRGWNRVTISRLPTMMEKDSVRISVVVKDSFHTTLRPQGKTPSVYLSDVVCSPSDNPSDSSIHRTILALELKRSGLESEKRRLDTQDEVMVSYARSLTGQNTSPTNITDFWSAFDDRGRKNIDAVLKIKEQMAEIDNVNETFRRTCSMKGTWNTELAATVVADGDMRAQFRLIYIVSDAEWSLNYKLHAVTGEDGRPSRKVTLHCQASVKQETGEDWKDAPLTLSTIATDTLMKKIPRLEPVKVTTIHTTYTSPQTIVPPMVIAQHSRSEPSSPSRTRSPSAHVATSFRVEPDFTSSQKHSAEEGTTVLSDDELWDRKIHPKPKIIQTPMTLSYAVRGNLDIPSNGKEHVVTIANLEFEADVEYISVPRLDPRVFLQFQVKNTSEYRLLAGPVSIIMDESYVSRTSLPDVNRNETFDFTVGDDPSVIVLYDCSCQVTKEGTQAYADPLDITTYTTMITAHNTHPFIIENIIIRDAVPTSADNKRIKVVLRKPQALIEAKEGMFVQAEDSRSEGETEVLMVKWEKKQDGLYEYRCRINAEDKVRFETVFDITAPSDMSYTLSNFAIQGQTA